MTPADLEAIKARTKARDDMMLLPARGDCEALLAEVERLRRALEAARRSHQENDGPPCVLSDGSFFQDWCICGADDHNEKIAAALAGGPTT